MNPSNEAFVDAAFSGLMDDETAWAAWFMGDPTAADRRDWAGLPVLRTPHWNIGPDTNNYVCISSFYADSNGEWRRRKSTFAGMHAVMVDDIGSKIPFARLVLTPSVMVETSPDNYQAWYFLDPVERDLEKADLLLRRMVASGLTPGARDPGMLGVTRYGRLPIGRNWKLAYRDDNGEPFQQRVHVWQPDWKVSVEDIALAYRLDLRPNARPLVRKRGTGPSSDTVVKALEDLGLLVGPMRGIPGVYHITCPWLHEHTGGDATGTCYFEPSNFNDWRGGFKCHHGHCAERHVSDLHAFLRAAARINARHLGAA
jgi:hypothetical protein